MIRDVLKNILNAIKDGGIILTVYICLLVVTLSFFAPFGYYMLGEYKAVCYLVIAGIFTLLLIPAIITGIREKAVNHHIGKWKATGASCIDIAVMTAFTLITVSFILAYDHRVSVFGLDGWRMGYVTYVFIFAGYVAARCISIEKYMKYILMSSELVSGAVFALGFINRLGIYPFPGMISMDTSFLSTIGNINWYSGYIAIFLPLAICDRVFMTDRIHTCDMEDESSRRISGIKNVRLILCDLCIFSGFLTLISMGGNTSVLILMAIVLTLVSVMIADSNKLFIILRLAIGFMLSLELYGLILLRPTTTYTYSTDVYWLNTAIGHYGIIWAVILSIVYLLEWYIMNYTGNNSTGDKAVNDDKIPTEQRDRKSCAIERIPIYMLITAGICMVFLVILLMYPVRFSDILAFAHKVTGVDFDDTFANGRGLIYRISGLASSRLPAARILLGTGPDGYYAYIMNDEVLSQILYRSYAGLRLTNAHSIFPTAFINEGLLYTIALCALLTALYIRLIRCIRRGNAKVRAYAYTGIMILTASVYVMMFTFVTVITLPLLAIATGVVITRI